MTRLAKWHIFAAGVFVGMILTLELIARADGPAQGTSDPVVMREIAPDVFADDRSALSLDGQGVRMLCRGAHCGNAGIIDAPVPVPLPWGGVLLVGAIGVLAWVRR